MKLSFCTDSLGHLPFEAMLDRLGELGVFGVEMTTGGWSSFAASCCPCFT